VRGTIDLETDAGNAVQNGTQPHGYSQAPVSRRAVVLEDLSQLMPEVGRLSRGNHTVGDWTLAQVCKHLADSINGSIDGFDLRNHRFKRFFLRRQMLKVALTKGIPRNYTVDPNLTPPPDVALEEAIEELRRAVERYRTYAGRLAAHPLFGRMPREVWDRVHCVHCAHHLSFVLPSQTDAR